MADTILDAVAAKAAPAVGAQVQKWTRILLDEANAKLMPLLPEEVQGLVAAALQTVEKNQELIGQTSQQGFLAIVSHLAMGREDQARKVWLASAAPFRDRMDALDAASEAVRARVRADAERWSAIRQVALDFLTAGGRVAIPLLLSLVGV